MANPKTEYDVEIKYKARDQSILEVLKRISEFLSIAATETYDVTVGNVVTFPIYNDLSKGMDDDDCA